MNIHEYIEFIHRYIGKTWIHCFDMLYCEIFKIIDIDLKFWSPRYDWQKNEKDNTIATCIAFNVNTKIQVSISIKSYKIFITGMSDADNEISEDELQLKDKKILDSWNVYRFFFVAYTSLLFYSVLTRQILGN